MTSSSTRTLYDRFRVTSLGTLTSRLLALIRDVAMAATLGVSGHGLMDAFVMAFRVPDLFRRLLAEGALTASFLPEFSRLLASDRRKANQLATTMLLAAALAGLVIVSVGELICASVAQNAGGNAQWTLMWQLTMLMLPFVFFICITAQLAATLHGLGHFTAPALVASLLNVCWLIGLVAAPRITSVPEHQMRILAGFIVLAGVLQTGLQWFALRQLGFRLRWNWAASRLAAGSVTAALLPALLGLAVVQINTFADSLMAWSLADAAMGTLDHPERWPAALRPGAVATVYYSERLIMFPLGLVGVATATAIFPTLSRRASQGDPSSFALHLTSGLQLVMFLSIPASAGLVLLAEPIVRAMLQRGAFTAEDTLRTANMVKAYGISVWAYCGIPLVVRGFYAFRDFATPMRVGVVAIAMNLVLNGLLVQAFAETGLALATATAAAGQLILLGGLLACRHSQLAWRSLVESLARALVATGGMVLVGWWLVGWWLARLSLPPLMELMISLVACVTIYFAIAWALGATEWRALLGKQPPNVDSEHSSPG